MSITIGNLTFDRVSYDGDADVLYLHVGDPSSAVDYDETPEGHGLRFGPEGSIVGLTLVSPRQTLEREGELRLTLPETSTVSAEALRSALAA